MEPLIALGILWLLGRGTPAAVANVTPTIVPSPIAPPAAPPPVTVAPPPAPVPITATPVFRSPVAPPPAQGPVTNPNSQGVPVPTTPPATVVTIDRPNPIPPPDNRPGFCRGPWMPFHPRACSGSEPFERRGPAPAGAWVVTGPVPGAQRSFNQSSCPDASRGLYIMQAGSLDWNNLCGANQPLE